ncbi:MAG: hypothetical protein LYZ69_09255 [Nitrososphaerales archaeon]|nr:hypothetical protein [Nitrososphaerales archaeon]
MSRAVVKRWLRDYSLTVTSRPEVGLSNYIRRRLASEDDRTKVAQWVMDEGSISVAFFKRTDLTSLVVCGSMNDFDVLSEISNILAAPITTS